ncbi:MAG: hypothetical protein ACE5FN_08200 [Leptospirillia bacterium]
MGGGGSGGGGSAACVGQGTQFVGAAYYEDKSYDLNGIRGRRMRPVRGAVVELYKAEWDANSGRWYGTGTLYDTGFTDNQGTYCLSTLIPPDNALVRVKAVAKARSGARTFVVDHSSIKYFAETARVSNKGTYNQIPTLNIIEDMAWRPDPINGASTSRIGGAFNILDVITSGANFIKDYWGMDLPQFGVAWQSFRAQGEGTYFLPAYNMIHVKGETAEDSDEYDDDIILHEFGHFVSHNLSRESSTGGGHSINGYSQDVRLAWSEGLASFTSAMIRDLAREDFSNISSVPATLIDSFDLTEGRQGAIRFAFELSSPQAFITDQRSNEAVTVSPSLFSRVVKHSTSEVSIGTAVWDAYKGVPGVPGIGVLGIRDILTEFPVRYPDGDITFTEFWQTYRDLFPERADGYREYLVTDRNMTLVDDVAGADDAAWQIDTLTGNELALHQFKDLAPSVYRVPSGNHSLYPEGDVDMFRMEVAGAGRFAVTTFNLHDGADTLLELLEADGETPLTVPDGAGGTVPVRNDNYIPLVRTVVFQTDGAPEVVTREYIDYNGTCGWVILSSRSSSKAKVNSCPPNAANPPPFEALYVPEYLASQVEVQLDPGVYYIRVSHSPDAPPSAGLYGGYDLKVTPL